ncbi:hypothetical protein REPUB_Repub17cG0006500 [Reevesia pubescens]
MHTVCFECGVYGHRIEKCPQKIIASDMEKSEASCNSFDVMKDVNKAPTDGYGPWMLAQRKPWRGSNSKRRRESLILEDLTQKSRGNMAAKLAVMEEDNYKFVVTKNLLKRDEVNFKRPGLPRPKPTFHSKALVIKEPNKFLNEPTIVMEDPTLRAKKGNSQNAEREILMDMMEVSCCEHHGDPLEKELLSKGAK